MQSQAAWPPSKARLLALARKPVGAGMDCNFNPQATLNLELKEEAMTNLATWSGACALGLASALLSSPAEAQVWEEICKEGNTCRVVGTRPIRYGADDKFRYGVATRVVHCNNDAFGDPAPNVLKHCYAYYTAEERANRKAAKDQGERIRALEEEVVALQGDLDKANAEIDGLYRELRRERRRDERRDARRRLFREQFGPFLLDR